jgi:hypothetical protein
LVGVQIETGVGQDYPPKVHNRGGERAIIGMNLDDWSLFVTNEVPNSRVIGITASAYLGAKRRPAPPPKPLGRAAHRQELPR